MTCRESWQEQVQAVENDGHNSGITGWFRWAGLALGPLAAGVVYLVLSGRGLGVGDVSEPGARVAAVATLMGVWWLSEALPLAVTAVLPIVLFPTLGVMPVKDAAAPFGDDLIFLFVGGFLLQLAMERWGLHRRIALVIILGVGTRPARLVGGLMLATAILSMWISNAASAAMMLPIGVSLCELIASRHGSGRPSGVRGVGGVGGGAEMAAHVPVPEHPDPHVRNLGKCVMIGVAWAATIGGIATPIGTAPNVLLRGYLHEQGIATLSFAQWMMLCLPMSAGFLVLAWGLLTGVFFPLRLPRGAARAEAADERALLVAELRALGPVKRGEWATMGIFSFAVFGWLFGGSIASALGLKYLSGSGLDSVVAMTAGVLLFVVPVDVKRQVFVMDWKHAARLPYGVLLLFGGGLSLAAGMRATGLDLAVGTSLGGLHGLHPVVVMLVLTAVVVALSEFMSNTALTVTLLPIVGAVERTLLVAPGSLLLPVALGASCAFMMPAGTPPSAIMFASGYFGIRDMARPGLLVNAIGVVLITVMIYTGLPIVMAWGSGSVGGTGTP